MCHCKCGPANGAKCKHVAMQCALCYLYNMFMLVVDVGDHFGTDRFSVHCAAPCLPFVFVDIDGVAFVIANVHRQLIQCVELLRIPCAIVNLYNDVMLGVHFGDECGARVMRITRFHCCVWSLPKCITMTKRQSMWVVEVADLLVLQRTLSRIAKPRSALHGLQSPVCVKHWFVASGGPSDKRSLP